MTSNWVLTNTNENATLNWVLPNRMTFNRVLKTFNPQSDFENMSLNQVFTQYEPQPSFKTIRPSIEFQSK